MQSCELRVGGWWVRFLPHTKYEASLGYMKQKSKHLKTSQVWWHISLMPALGKQRQWITEFHETSLVHRASPRTARGTLCQKQQTPFLCTQ